MKTYRSRRHALMIRAAAPALALALVAGAASAASAQDARRAFEIAPQPLADALLQFARQADIDIVAAADLTRGRTAPAVRGELTAAEAMAQLLAGSGLEAQPAGGGLILARASAPQSGSAAGGGAEVEALIVTAQKREEDIQDVPIAISAFSQETLERSQVAGGPDLMTQVPNMTFTKTNFSSYSIQIRGIGTQAISATVDPAVAVAFNNTPFVRNRFFEQEFYDLQRVEVLRGPQGTLYGRNATAGVVNIISAKPKFAFESKLSGDVSNYNSTRLEGMVNVPLVEDKVALRLAAAWTKRDGYATNGITGNPIDGRDLWSTRASLRFTPTDNIDVNLIWEHFEEDDDRIRSGKQLCNTHEVTELAGFPVTHFQTPPNIGQNGAIWAGSQATWSQGCLPTSLYAPESFQTPNGLSLPYYVPLNAVFLPAALTDPYLSRTQSTDLRVIESTVDPEYRAKADTVELQATFDVTDNLSLTSETAWASDFVFSTQDFNRFNTAPGAWDTNATAAGRSLVTLGILSSDGVFCDPQVGCADRLVGVDLSTAKSRHFSQELRLASNYDGPFNFSLGANFLRYDTEDKYYVFINSLTLISLVNGSFEGGITESNPYVPGVSDSSDCLSRGLDPADFNVGHGVLGCTYIDPNPIGNLNDLGHNYFLSRNPYKLISYAVFGEAYYNITETLKVTAGLRWTVDKKEAPRIPSWLLATQTAGLPVMEVVEQEWREPTGRLTIDWKPDLAFTDETLLYASYARGYKAGGANPPSYGPAVFGDVELQTILIDRSATTPKTFEAEFVDAFELGSKNTFLDGRMTLNLAGFYYDYKGYQLSQIVDRSAVTQNFDSEVWGLELEADWRPLENLKLGLKLGYEDTKVGEGMQAIDLMDRTAGNEDWVVVRPFPSIPSNCVLPAWLFVGNTPTPPQNPELVTLGALGGGGTGACDLAYAFGFDPATWLPYVANPPAGTIKVTHDGTINYTAYSTNVDDFPGWTDPTVTNRTYPGWNPATDYGNNHGQGFFKDLSGNELPNAPNFTATITADYTVPLPSDWLMTLHTDLYYQSEAWTRIFNTEGYDKLKAYTNVNLAAIFTNEEAGWKVMAYVKNVFDRDSITGAFLFSDDVGLTTNVFLTEPRLYGLRVTKEWNGGPWWTGANPNHTGPYPLTVELSGQVQRQDAPYETLVPTWIDAFPDNLNPLAAQNRDFDWGDGRQVKLTWRPEGTPWSVSAAARYGRTNTDTARVRYEEEGPSACIWGGAFSGLCDPEYYGGYFYSPPIDSEHWADGSARSQEDHVIVDFVVGRDAGLGILGVSRSTFGLGLRYAQFDSGASAEMDGIPEWHNPDGQKYPQTDSAHSTRYQASFEASREFEGLGPMLSWDAAAQLFGDEQMGHVNLDWTLSAGALFGKQKTSVTGEETQIYWSGVQYSGTHIPEPEDIETTELDIAPRSKSLTVPVVDLSLGLSYEIQRIKIGAGYRWERYFDVIDGGFEERKESDRTLDGPYFKLSVGFGG